MPVDRQASEFGGVPGRIAPLPHEPSAAESARLERNIDPMNPNGDAVSQRIVEADDERRSVANPDAFTGEPMRQAVESPNMEVVQQMFEQP